MSPISDSDIANIRFPNKKIQRSAQLSHRGDGSVYIEIYPTGLVRLSHRIREGRGFLQTKLGLHSSCYADKYKDFPDEKFIGLEEAMKAAEELVAKVSSGDSYQSVHRHYKKRKQREKSGYASFEQMLLGYLEHMQGRRDYTSIRSTFKCHILEEMSNECRRYGDLLRMDARDVTPEDLKPIIDDVINVKGKGPTANKIIAHISAATTWAKNYDEDVTVKESDRISGTFGIQINPFLGMKKYTQFINKGKYQLTDKQLWLLWHESLRCMGISGRVARILIAIGGIRQEHLIKMTWDDFEEDAVYPNIESVTHKTGSGHKPVRYACALNSLCLHEILELRNITGHRKFLFPVNDRALSKKPADRHMRHDAFDKPFKRLHQHVLKEYGYTLPHLSMGMLRGTISTFMADAGVEDGIKDKIQMYNIRNVKTEHYERYQFMEAKLRELNKWDQYLRKLLNTPFSELKDVHPEERKVDIDNPAKVVARPL